METKYNSIKDKGVNSESQVIEKHQNQVKEANEMLVIGVNVWSLSYTEELYTTEEIFFNT